MHIVLWQNAICTFDSSFFAGFLKLWQVLLQKFVYCKCCNFLQKRTFSHQSKKLWVGT